MIQKELLKININNKVHGKTMVEKKDKVGKKEGKQDDQKRKHKWPEKILKMLTS